MQFTTVCKVKSWIIAALNAALTVSLALGYSNASAEGAGFDEEILVVGTTPGGGPGLDVNKIPFAVQTADADAFERSQSLDLSDYMNANLGSVSINSAQNNPLQPDLQFRGFTASPLLGLAQGISVYQNGARINEPLGDAVNWDLLPQSAINSISLISGANPLFGLNTLGGALSIEMKDGFTFQGHQAEIYGGSWDRIVGNIESGGNNGAWGYYINVNYFEEDNWRDLSESDALNAYGSISWRDGDRSEANLSVQYGDSDLIGNGTLPVGLLGIDRAAVFTAPDITENDMYQFVFDANHFITDKVQVAGTAFYRNNDTDSLNGDGSDFEECEFFGGEIALLEETDDIEDALVDDLGIELDDICEAGDPAITSFDDLEQFIETQAGLAGLDPQDFELEDVIDELSGSGEISDEAIDNQSTRKQESYGIDGQLTFMRDLFGRDNRFTVGLSYFNGESAFTSIVELAELDPATRSTEGLGLGTFVDEAATNVRTETETASIYFTDTWSLTNTLSLTFAGRYNDTDVTLRDRSRERPELNGDHNFSRFNPSIGVTFTPAKHLNFYASYSESNRAPTPIELACNEGVFELAQQFAIEDGEDPDDIEFECRLPNAFLADPPLDDVVAKSYEIGVRGVFNATNYRLGFFHTVNKDDILFQTTGRSTGLFANIDETKRLGFESAFAGAIGKLDWFAAYSYIEATFEDDFMALSPEHDFANDAGEIAIEKGDRIPGIPEHTL
ncbi:MAG: TonB-dependent receptor, partial [Pseudomonadales bacterium]